MANPFEKRATEYFRDDEAFLAIVTPEPLVTFLQQPAHDGSLYDPSGDHRRHTGAAERRRWPACSSSGH